MPSAALETEIGWLEVAADDTDTTITRLHWRHGKPKQSDSTPLLDKAIAELRAYLAGERRDFDLPLHAEGDDLAEKVWEIMRQIPYGQTLTYGDVAKRLNVPAQEIGQACGRNPIAVLIPCHRITGTNWLGGYSSDLGTTAKRFLLDLEFGQGRLF
ncbi:MAG TPA: methylated-DNA--[protein]-cysteine S-methyltransferase [Dongiaceae bacterium]|jgi:methylated-DNA-[protein]-cysteine S-methyltransferase